MKTIIFAILALISTPALAIGQCGPNRELPSDISQSELDYIAQVDRENAEEERKRIESNKIRDASLAHDPKALETIREMISHTRQQWVKNKSYDFLLNGTKKLIEVQGDFWHANPELYKKDDVLNHYGQYLTAEEIWRKDAEKKKNAENYGYEVYYIWEKDMNVWSDQEVLEYLLEITEFLKLG